MSTRGILTGGGLTIVGLVAVALLPVTAWGRAAGPVAPATVQFIFTSDAHYGITRPMFRGRPNVDGHAVNAAMIARMNTLAGETFPNDGGLKSGEPVGALDFLAQGGDIANREEDGESTPIQSAAQSWAQFSDDYLRSLKLVDRSGARAPVFVVPGNHDVSNAVGFYKPMKPAVDKTAMVAIYNLMMAPGTPKTSSTFEYPRDAVDTSRDLGGVHFVFDTVWPDSKQRAWMDDDLARVAPSTPVVIVTHDQPPSEAKHFTNPNGRHDINSVDKFENLLVDTLADGTTIDAPTDVEQRGLEAFLARHPNITAYFHGNSNWNEFYEWNGPGRTAALHTFRVDSPMKGHFSADDETKLSFQVATIDQASGRMTVRECLWNRNPASPSGAVAWGESVTVDLSPRTATRASRVGEPAVGH